MQRWYYLRNGQVHGPLTLDELRKLHSDGLVQREDRAWPTSGTRESSIPALQVPGLACASAQPGLPDWLEDVAAVENVGPLPSPTPGEGPPDWLEDLRLWYDLEYAPRPPAPPPAPAPQLTLHDWPRVTPTPASAAPPAVPGIPVPMPIAVTPPAASPPVAPPSLPLPPSKPPLAPPTARPTNAAPPATPRTATVLREASKTRLRDETGVDPDTGQVLDEGKFHRWQKQRAGAGSGDTPDNATLLETFRTARIEVEKWVDEPANRALVLKGDMQEIGRHPYVIAVFRKYLRAHPSMQEKLWRHLTFMVENRQKFYTARPND